MVGEPEASVAVAEVDGPGALLELVDGFGLLGLEAGSCSFVGKHLLSELVVGELGMGRGRGLVHPPPSLQGALA